MPHFIIVIDITLLDGLLTQITMMEEKEDCNLNTSGLRQLSPLEL